jgi:hypothetical protein
MSGQNGHKHGSCAALDSEFGLIAGWGAESTWPGLRHDGFGKRLAERRLSAIDQRACGEVAELVDRVALEMRSTGNRTGGSNPSLSASFL